MEMKKTLFLLSVVLAGHFSRAQAQDLEKLLWDNPWLNRSNVAGMAFSGRDYSVISLYGTYRGGSFRNVYDPVSCNTFGLQTRSYVHRGNVFLSGSFQYEYQSRKDQQWLGLQDPYKTPFMLADSVAGAYALETYRMHAAVAVPVSKKLTLGGSLSYNARSGAKHRDLRNSDLYMDFEISPSLVYQSGPARIGAHLYFRRITEQVDFTQVETSTNKILFSFSGLWFNTRQVFTTSAPRTRLLKDHLYGGGLTAQYTVGKFSLYDHFSAGFRDQSQREDVVLAKKFGDVREWSWENTLILYYGERHRLVAEASRVGLTGYLPVQRQELNEASRLWEWVQYGSIPSFVQETFVMGLNYSYRVPRNESYDSWRFSAGMNRMQFMQQWIRYPVSVQRSWDRLDAFVNLTKNWSLKHAMLDLSPEFSYGTGSLTATDPEALPDPADLQSIGFENPDQFFLREQAAKENEYMTSPRLSAGLRLRITFFGGRNRNLNLFAETGYRYMRSLSAANRTFHSAGLNIGVLF